MRPSSVGEKTATGGRSLQLDDTIVPASPRFVARLSPVEMSVNLAQKFSKLHEPSEFVLVEPQTTRNTGEVNHGLTIEPADLPRD